MIQALIVDDEPMHIQGLIRHINWEILGYAPPLTTESGEEALTILAGNRIDVLITDVLMPGMTGIELLTKCNSDYPHLQLMQTVIISGYDEFEFVREAIDLGVKAYVMKPVKTVELEEKLISFRAAIEKKHQIEQETLALQRTIAGSREVLQERFVNDLIQGRILNIVLMDSWRRLLELPTGEWQIRLFLFGYDRLYPSNPNDAKQRILFSEGLITSVRVGVSGITGIYIGKTEADEAAVIHLNAPPRDRAKLEKQVGFIQDVLKEQFQASVTAGISRECQGWEMVPLLYKEVKHMMANSRFAGGGQTLYFDRFKMTEYREFSLREEYIPEIVKKLEQGEIENAAVHFINAFDVLQTQEPVSFSYVQAFGMGLISELARKINRGKESEGEINILIWQRLLDCTGAEEIRAIVLEYFNQFSGLKQKEQIPQQHNLIHRIARYMEEHLQDNVTVKQLSEIFYLNSSYLSVLFKKEMGKTISDFVLETRMARAKELLREPNIKVYEVAEQVGFQTTAYFTFLFKRMTGITPKEFRDYHYGD